jgi:hypothetical protein
LVFVFEGRDGMARKSKELIVLFYDPGTRMVWGKGGKFVSLEEFVKYPPVTQNEVTPPKQSESIPDPPDVEPEPGPVLKCINGKEHLCYLDRCYPTGRDC